MNIMCALMHMHFHQSIAPPKNRQIHGEYGVSLVMIMVMRAIGMLCNVAKSEQSRSWPKANMNEVIIK